MREKRPPSARVPGLAPCIALPLCLALMLGPAACATAPGPPPADEAPGPWARASEAKPLRPQLPPAPEERPGFVRDDPPATVYAAEGGAPILTAPDTGAEKLDVAPAGRALVRFGALPGWAKVLDTETRRLGWARAGTLAPAPPASSPAEAPGSGTISETF